MASGHSESTTTVYAAIGANLVIALSKLFVALASGSSAMLSEGIHSFVDTGNQLLLILGMKRSQRPADPMHPFGHGKELYFWSLIVAILLFGLGGGMSVYEGISHLRHPGEIRDPFWNYVVLGISLAAESTSWVVALRSFQAQKKDDPFWPAFLSSKDPTVFTILAEDSAAIAGLLAAFAGIFLTHRTNNPVFDGAASLLIGGILAAVAVFLAVQSRGLLIGERASERVIRRIRELAESDPAIRNVQSVLTMHFGPDTILLNMDVEFQPHLAGSSLAETVDRLEGKIREEMPEIKRIFIETKSVSKLPGEKAAQPGWPTTRIG